MHMPISHFIIILVLFFACIYYIRRMYQYTNNTLNLNQTMSVLAVALVSFIAHGITTVFEAKRHNIHILDLLQHMEPQYIIMEVILIIFIVISLVYCIRIRRLFSAGQEIYTTVKIVECPYRKIDMTRLLFDVDLILCGHNPYTGKDLELKTTIKHNSHTHKVISPLKDGDTVKVYISKNNDDLFIADLREYYKWHGQK